MRRSQLLAKVLRRRLASNAGRGVGRCASLFTHSSLTLHSLFTHSSLTLACSTRCVACSPLSPAERLQASTLRSWKETKPVTSAVSSWRSISVQPSMQTRTFRSCCIALTLSARSASSSGGSCKGSGLKSPAQCAVRHWMGLIIALCMGFTPTWEVTIPMCDESQGMENATLRELAD